MANVIFKNKDWPIGAIIETRIRNDVDADQNPSSGTSSLISMGEEWTHSCCAGTSVYWRRRRDWNPSGTEWDVWNDVSIFNDAANIVFIR